MTGDQDLSDRPLPQRIVLLTVVHCVVTGTEPVHTGRVCQACSDRREAMGEDVLGRLGEAEVSRALNALEADGYVEMAVDDPSPTGKGRPGYTLAVDADAVVDALQSDERTEPLVEAFAADWS